MEDIISQLPGYEGTERQVGAVQDALLYITRSGFMTQTEIADALNIGVDALPYKPGEIHLPEKLKQQHISEFLEKYPQQVLRDKYSDIPWLAWHWLLQQSKELLAQCYRAGGHACSPQSYLANEIHDYLSESQLFKTSEIALLQGEYLLIRRFFKRAMVSKLSCGDSSDATRFTFSSSYINVFEEEAAETIEGYLIPYADRVLLFGRFIERPGPFIAILTGLRYTADRCDMATGLLLTAASNEPPGSFPFLLLRAELKLKAGVHDLAALESNETLWSLLAPILAIDPSTTQENRA